MFLLRNVSLQLFFGLRRASTPLGVACRTHPTSSGISGGRPAQVFGPLSSIFAICALCALALNTGCTSVFYYPDRVPYGDPLSLPYKSKEFYLPSEDPNSERPKTAAPKREAKISEKIHGIWYEPNERTKGTVIHFHGNAQNLSAHLEFSYWIPEFGYSLVVFDYRGYGKSGGEVTRQGTIDDGVAILRKVMRETPSEERIHVFGQSLGGAIALSAVAQLEPSERNRICSLVLESTFGSYRSLVRQKVASLWPLWLFQYPISWFFSDQGAPFETLSRIDQNSLVLHGDADPVVPLAAGRELFERLSTPQKSLEIHPGGIHTPFFIRPQSPWRPRLAAHLDQLKCRQDEAAPPNSSIPKTPTEGLQSTE